MRRRGRGRSMSASESEQEQYSSAEDDDYVPSGEWWRAGTGGRGGPGAHCVCLQVRSIARMMRASWCGRRSRRTARGRPAAGGARAAPPTGTAAVIRPGAAARTEGGGTGNAALLAGLVAGAENLGPDRHRA